MLSQSTRRLLIYGLAALPLAGWFAISPFLIYFPIYSDELQWKLINARMLIDGGKLVYLFPVCSKGFLLDPPISWYPTRLLDAFLYADLSNPQRLRYLAIAIFAAIILYLAWFMRRIKITEAPYLVVIGGILAPLSMGVLPFLLVMNRPEQSVIIPLLIGCTLPLLMKDERRQVAQAWLLALLYTLLAWMILASHIKGIFLLPAFLLAAYFAIRRWLPWTAVVVCTTYGAIETFRLWDARTDCPESPFLTQIFRNLSLSPGDLHQGLLPFIQKVLQNLFSAGTYWQHIMFQHEYQSAWLPNSRSPLGPIEHYVNLSIPILIAVAVVLVVIAVMVETRRVIGQRCYPRPSVLIALFLVAGLVAISGFQITKNFYEASLQVPVIGLAVALALPSLRGLMTGGIMVVCLMSVCATASQYSLISRFSVELPQWKSNASLRESQQAKFRQVLDRCGLDVSQRTSRVLMGDFEYSVLWSTREPLILPYFHGWWATGIDQAKLIRDRKISYVAGACSSIPSNFTASAVTDGTFCCTKLPTPTAGQ